MKPSFCSGVNYQSFWDTVVSILHYTLGLMITYSSREGIVAVTPVSMLIEMVEIVIFYVFIGFLVSNIADEAVKKGREK